MSRNGTHEIQARLYRNNILIEQDIARGGELLARGDSDQVAQVKKAYSERALEREALAAIAELEADAIAGTITPARMEALARLKKHARKLGLLE